MPVNALTIGSIHIRLQKRQRTLPYLTSLIWPVALGVELRFIEPDLIDSMRSEGASLFSIQISVSRA